MAKNPKEHIVSAQWNFSADGGALSTITFAKNCVIPKGAILKRLQLCVIADANNVSGSTLATIFKWYWGENGNATYDSQISHNQYPNNTYDQGNVIAVGKPTGGLAPLYANNRARKDMVLKVNISGSSPMQSGIIDVYATYLMLPL